MFNFIYYLFNMSVGRECVTMTVYKRVQKEQLHSVTSEKATRSTIKQRRHKAKYLVHMMYISYVYY